MSKYKCIIFDCDGVLVDSEAIGIDVLVDMANALGANMSKDKALMDLKGKSLYACMRVIENNIEKSLPDTFEKEYRAKTFKIFKAQIQPIKGIKKVLEHLELPYGVASSGPENKIRLNLETTGLLPYFEGKIFSCFTIKKWKPEPDVYLWAAKTMGFLPKECLVIEDSVSGVKAAKAGGFDVFGYTGHDYRNELEALATKTFSSMDKLLGMI
jgi:HAD superfamily hydrolase (TIGR01509 family)